MGKKILVAPLSWGLGHATRDLPIIRRFLADGHQVSICSSGRTLALLEREVPECDFITLEDYPTPYTRSRWFVLKFAAFIPRMLAAIKRERQAAEKIIQREKFDLVLSDNRFGVRHPDVPCFFISHQLRFAAPWFLWPFQCLGEFFNRVHHRKFLRVIVPDVGDPEHNLSGKLAHRLYWPKRERYYYAGVLSSTQKMDVEEDVDLLISISGPEPQRTEFEKIVMAQLDKLSHLTHVVVALGKPEVTETTHPRENVEVHGFLERAQQQEMMNRAKMIVSRSGYTTVMEIAELGKKALFTPTPGQTEQVYLSDFYEASGQFHSVSQYDLNLAHDLDIAATYPGLEGRHNTPENVDRLFKDVFDPYLR
jgi:UDP:flavonoid glycosyltransferase YjiC (YdhE family)